MDLTFDKLMDFCPVCEDCDLQHKSLRSKNGFMSLPDIPHSFCRGCGSYFVNPQITNSSLELFYKSQVTEDAIEKHILQSSIDRYFNEKARRYFIENRIHPIQKYVPPNSRLLDIGCGTGVFVRFMKDFGYQTQGIDISPRSVTFGRKKLGLNKELNIAHWSDFPGRDYHLVSAWTLIEHLKEPNLFLKKAYVKLSTGGHLILEFPTVDSLLFQYLKSGFFWVMPYYHLFLFSRDGMKKMLKRNGFELVEEHNMPSNWYFVESVLKEQGLDAKEMAKIAGFPDMAKRIDQIFDDISFKMGQSSSVQFICRKKV